MMSDAKPNEPSAWEALVSGKRGMVFLHYNDPRFRRGLEQHGLLDCSGTRVLSIGLSGRPFSDCFPATIEANAKGTPFHVDRICGGAPYMDIAGIEDIAQACANNPAFLGFQAHEWGHASILDNRRIDERFTRAGLAFNVENFASYRNRSQRPYFSAGDHETYRNLAREIRDLSGLGDFFRGFLSHFSDRTQGQLMAVNGYFQLYHLAAEIGSRSLVAEVGNQVPLTCMQIAAARGAAKQAGKHFGVYYEPWGGKPPSCTSALPWSPWFGEDIPLEEADQGLGLAMGRDLGSSRSLQKRLLYYSWLSGAEFVSEEWGPENYFFDWKNYDLTDYGRIAAEFQAISSRHPRPEPLLPLAIVMPPDAVGIDNIYLTEPDEAALLFKTLEADPFHRMLRDFSRGFLAARPHARGLDDSNLTPSPFTGSFDVLSHGAEPALLNQYDLILYFDDAQFQKSVAPDSRKICYQDVSNPVEICRAAVRKAWPVQVDGEAGCTFAKIGRRHVVGIFNNLGVVKEGRSETADPKATRPVRIRGRMEDLEILDGSKFATEITSHQISLELPGGELFAASFSTDA